MLKTARAKIILMTLSALGLLILNIILSFIDKEANMVYAVLGSAFFMAFVLGLYEAGNSAVGKGGRR